MVPFMTFLNYKIIEVEKTSVDAGVEQAEGRHCEGSLWGGLLSTLTVSMPHPGCDTAVLLLGKL